MVRDGRQTPHSSKAGFWCDRSAVNFSEPTVGALVRLTKSFFRSLDRGLSLSCNWCKGISLISFGVHPPQDGLTLAVSAAVAEGIALALIRFTKRRPIRKANDLSRPLRSLA